MTNFAGLFLIGSFVAMASAAIAAPSPDACPDLTGTYAVKGSEVLTRNFGLWKHSRIRTRPLVTFRREGKGWALTWHPYREDALKAASLLAQSDRERYGRWVDMTFRDPSLPLPQGAVDPDAWESQKASAGPSLQVGEDVLPFIACKQGWFQLSGPVRRSGPPSFEGGAEGTREIETWLGRGPGGALELRADEHRTIELTAPSRGYKELSVRKSSRSHTLGSWAAAPAQDLTPWRLEELPVVERPSQRRPKCQIDPDKQDVFYRRLKALLQPPTELVHFSASIESGRPRPDGSCEPTDFTMVIDAIDAVTAGKVTELLANEPFVKQVVSKDAQERGAGRQYVRFRMKVGP